MGKRYSIMVRQYGTDYETELCQCNTSPEQLVAGAQEKRIKIDRGDRKVFIPKYEHVYIRDNEEVR